MPRALQVIAGSFPIAQTREPYSAIQFIAERLPIETIYKLTPPTTATETSLKHKDEDEDENEDAGGGKNKGETGSAKKGTTK